MKAHTLGESLILPACKKAVSTILENNVAKEISEIPMPKATVPRSILEMFSNIEKSLSSNKLQYSHFALQVDESTSTTYKAQLLAVIHFIEVQIINPFRLCKELSVTTKGKDVFYIPNIYVDK